jgi:hypothetical protein
LPFSVAQRFLPPLLLELNPTSIPLLGLSFPRLELTGRIFSKITNLERS